MKTLQHIGIASVTLPGALLCMETIVAESYRHFGKEARIHPHITLTQPPLHEIEPLLVKKDWSQVATCLLASIDILSKAGVDFVIIPSNAPHYAIKHVQEKSPLPVLSIVEISVTECLRRGFKKVGILGMDVTMSDGLYVAPLQQGAIEPVTLPPEKQKALSHLIYNEIIIGKPTLKTAERLRVFIQELLGLGCDAFIAACTEIPIVITTEDESPLPFIDTTRLLAKKAFAYAAHLSEV
jgi:aspartate racemase